MANPMEMASPGFWDTVKNFDNVVVEINAPVRPLFPQFELIGKVDTEKIKNVMKEVWGEDESVGMRASLANSLQNLLDAKNYIGQGWYGDAFIAFNSAADEVKNPLSDVSGPLGELVDTMKEMAGKFEQSVGYMIATFSGFGGVLAAIGGFIGALMAAPEPVVTKVLGLITTIIGTLMAAGAYLAAQVTAIEDRQKAAQAAISECTSLVKMINN